MLRNPLGTMRRKYYNLIKFDTSEYCNNVSNINNDIRDGNSEYYYIRRNCNAVDDWGSN